MFLSYKKGLKLDGTNPTLLYGYGGFNISLLPDFAPSHVLWMEMGGVYAQPSLRGGGEYGEAWHQAGIKLKKQNVFDDFIAAAQWLIANQYTSPQKLAISGGSNGGLLVGAVETQRPELFGAALIAVGVMDMLRFDKFTIGWAWKDDYGSPSDNKPEFEAIYRYSPLHNLHPGVPYPPTLIMTADHDDRVFPAHSFKFAAAMQAAIGTQPQHRPRSHPHRNPRRPRRRHAAQQASRTGSRPIRLSSQCVTAKIRPAVNARIQKSGLCKRRRPFCLRGRAHSYRRCLCRHAASAAEVWFSFQDLNSAVETQFCRFRPRRENQDKTHYYKTIAFIRAENAAYCSRPILHAEPL